MVKSQKENNDLNNAYLAALKFAKSHYENFPVVSLFLPKYLHKHIAVVYKFARQADDLADEGNEKAERSSPRFDESYRVEAGMQNLELYGNQFTQCLDGEYVGDFWCALHHTITEFKLSPQNFLNLISAFKQDVVKNRYNSQDEVFDYCLRSANPVGRIILEFFDVRDEQLIKYSDSICTALQLTNFYQDVSVDILKGRIYIPLDEMKNFNVDADQFLLKRANDNFKKLIKFRVEETRKLFIVGRKLISHLPQGLKRQIKMTIMGGEKILDKIASLDYDVLNSRPSLSKLDYATIFIKAFVP